MTDTPIKPLSASPVADGGYPGVVYWFRNDLRLHDPPALCTAIAVAERLGVWLLPVFVHDTGLQVDTAWGFPRTGARRLAWRAMALAGLSHELTACGSALWEFEGSPANVLTTLVRALGGPLVVCEALPAPEERWQLQSLAQAGIHVQAVWQSTLMPLAAFPDPAAQGSDQFTPFRQALRHAQAQPAVPVARVQGLPALPDMGSGLPLRRCAPAAHAAFPASDPVQLPQGACFDMMQPALHGSELAGLAHLSQYCQRGLPHHYKATRNGLMGVDYSTKWSPWLATGALSARQAWAAVAAFADQQGANEGTEWILFELLWRDYFRWLHLRHGNALYRAGGLRHHAPPAHNPAAFQRWCDGQTGQPFIDAGMRELASTGYLSNRMRQVVASYLIHDLRCDWRAGAAWFESQLLDFDVFSNQGNWLYLSGSGTDPRGARRFNPVKQAQDHDPQGCYQSTWLMGQ